MFLQSIMWKEEMEDKGRQMMIQMRPLGLPKVFYALFNSSGWVWLNFCCCCMEFFPLNAHQTFCVSCKGDSDRWDAE